MDVPLTPGLQEQLEQSAAKRGRSADELVQEALVRYLEDEARNYESLEIWKEADWLVAIDQVEVGFLAVEPGEPIDSVRTRREIQEFKDSWRKQRQPAPKQRFGGLAQAMDPRR